jgi:hypothetical protein
MGKERGQKAASPRKRIRERKVSEDNVKKSKSKKHKGDKKERDRRKEKKEKKSKTELELQPTCEKDRSPVVPEGVEASKFTSRGIAQVPGFQFRPLPTRNQVSSYLLTAFQAVESPADPVDHIATEVGERKCKTEQKEKRAERGDEQLYEDVNIRYTSILPTSNKAATTAPSIHTTKGQRTEVAAQPPDERPLFYYDLKPTKLDWDSNMRYSQHMAENSQPAVPAAHPESTNNRHAQRRPRPIVAQKDHIPKQPKAPGGSTRPNETKKTLPRGRPRGTSRSSSEKRRRKS